MCLGPSHVPYANHHQHVHETIQPVVHKEVIQPEVVHTTVPVHETHHNAAKHHNTSELPPVSIGEFQKKGGVLGGREERYDGFEGEPTNIGGAKGLMGGVKNLVGGNKKDSHSTNDPSLKSSAQHGDFDGSGKQY